MSPARAVVALAALLVSSACDSGEAACIAGREGCPCAPGNTCESSPDAPLTCDHGWCVARDCSRGSEGCGCYDNGTCDPADGVPMTCEDGRCRATIAPEPGMLNGPCAADGSCGDHDGVTLECRSGRCELPECPSGELGCPCGSYGACDPYADREPRCTGGLCAIAGCTAGGDGCACRPDGSCDAGSCRRGLCLAEPGTPLQVIGDVRACEVVIDVGAERAEVTFADGILGHSRRRGDRLAIAFTQRRDRAFDAPPARIESSSEAQLVSATCFDRLGHRAGGAHVLLGEAP